MIAGRIDYMCPTLALAVSLIESKTVKAFATLSLERAPRMPNLPTAHEQGLANFEVVSWNALFLPKGTPVAIVRRLNEATGAVLARPDFRTKVEANGATVVAPERRSPEYLQAFVDSEIKKWAAPIKASGVSAD
jgi:tripartite-type tricarboxylate transporter receptor subunit TctC